MISSALNLSKLIPFFAEYEALLFTSTSAVDSFLTGVNLVCELQIPVSEVLIKSVRDEIYKKYGKSNELAEYFSAFYRAKWFRYLGGLRNLIAHRTNSSIIIANDLNLYLPDNPGADLVTIKKNFKLFDKLNDLLNQTQESLNFGFGYLENML